MGIFARIATIIKANINDLISKAEDPRKMLEQMLIDMQESYAEAKSEVAGAIADEKRLEKSYLAEKENAVRWEKKAMLAVQAGDDNLAREALARQAEHENLANQWQEQYLSQKEATDKLRSALNQLRNKIEEARRKKNLLIARAKRAEAQSKINKTMSSLQDSAAFDSFSRMENKIDEMEAKAEAESELNEEFSGDTLEKKFENLEATAGVEDKLAALKAKMSKA